MPPRKTFTDLMDAADATVESLAALAMVTASTIYRAKRGGMPNPNNRRRIAVALHVTEYDVRAAIKASASRRKVVAR